MANSYRVTLKLQIWPTKISLIYSRDPNPAFICGDCATYINSMNEPYYMVNNSLWQEFGNGYKMLCISCLSRRVGRELRITDFTDAPINGSIRYGFSLKSGNGS